MSLRYRDNAGREVIVASLTPGGDIESGAVATRSGSFNITFNGSATSEGNVAVTFDQPMPDDDYDVSFSYNGQWTGVSLYANQKTANGFNVCYANIVSSTATRTYNYRAIKTYTVQHAAQNAESIANLEAMIPTGAGSGNKLVTASQLTNTTSPIATDVANLKDLVPVGASITNQLVTKSEASVDSAFSSTSEHAVQNKIVKAALDGKQDTLTFDAEPTIGSLNPVRSNGVKAANDDIWSVINKNGAKNLIPYPYLSAPSSMFSINSDGSVLVNGTAGSSASRFFFTPYHGYYLKAGSYILSDGRENHSSNIYLQVYDSASPYTSRATTGVKDNVLFTLEEDTEVVIQLNVVANTTVTNDLFYPMLRLAEDTDSTYQPYAETNYQLTQDKMSYADNGILGAKNLLPSNKATATVLGVSYTSQSDGSFIVTGATTTSPSYSDVMFGFTLPAGTYIFSSPNTGITSDIELVLDDITSGTSVRVSTLYNSTAVTFTLGSTRTLHCYMWINSNITLPSGGVHFYPMIRLASDPDSIYQPYAMTNRKLTNQKIDLYGLTSSTAPWPGTTLTFKITPDNGIMYHLVAMEAARQDTDIGMFCEAYIIMRAMGATAPNIRNTGKNNIVGTWDASSSSLIITLPGSSYWLYRFSIEGLHPTAKV